MELFADWLLHAHAPPTASIASHCGPRLITPNSWFTDRFPDHVAQYGLPFFETTASTQSGFTQIVPVHLNESFFASMLSGASGIQIVHLSSEDTFYFYDYQAQAFCPTTRDKLKLLISDYLMRCARDCSSSVDVSPLLVRFRKEDVLSAVVRIARTVLQANTRFFKGPQGKRRFVNGRYLKPTDLPCYHLFVQKNVIANPDGRLTVAYAFHRYYQFCRANGLNPMKRADFRDLVTEAIREDFGIGKRHDVPDEKGKDQHGWHGLECIPAV